MVVQHGAGAFWSAAALGLLSLCALTSGSGAIRPSDHGLAFQRNSSGVDAAAMAAFFRGDGGGGAHPEARNATGSWEARAAPLVVDSGKNRLRRRVLLTVAVACGAAGVALLAGAALFYLVQTRQEKARRRRGNVAASGTSTGTCEGRV